MNDSERARSKNAVIDSDTLDAELSETIGFFLDAANRAGARLAAHADAQEHDFESRARREQLAAETLTELRDVLRDELTVVSKLDEGRAIEETERQREIAKSALALLHKPELQEAAAALKLPKSGTKADLLERLLERVGADAKKIAGLIGRVERAPTEGRRHAARLFSFDDLPENDDLARTLRAYEQRYVRTDLARWFVLDSATAEDQAVTATGEFRTYEVGVTSDDLEPHPRNFSVALRRVGSEPILRTYARLEPETVSAVEAFGLFTGRLPLPPLAFVARQRPQWRSSVGLDHQTTWLLGVLLGLVDREDVTLEDVTSATFVRPRSDRATVGSEVPHVGSAKLRGQHVLDSQSACRHLMANERLTAVTAMVRFTTGDAAVRLPVRLAVMPTYVAAMTGFGTAGAKDSRILHRGLEDHLVAQMARPTIDPERLESVLAAMSERAAALEPPPAADLFARGGQQKVRLET
jgi:hypothetical protein